MTAKEAVKLMADQAESLGAEANDTQGVVRGIVATNLPNRPDAQFYAWFSICCELADRAARKQGYTSAVARAYSMAKANIAARKKHCPGCSLPYTGDYEAFAATHECPNCPTRSYGLHEEDGETGADCRDADPQGWS